MATFKGIAIKTALAGLALSMAANAEFKVVGYLPSWGNAIQTVQYKKLTHVIWSFAAPADNGSLSGYDGAKLTQLVAAAHPNKVKVFLAVGGGGNGDKGWSVATASDAGRQALVKACMDAVHTYSLDGIDFDWEYPDGAQVAGFNATVKLLAAALHAEGKQISAAVTMNDWPKSFPTKELYDGVAPGFDFLNIMVYDNPAPHSTVQHAVTGLDVWLKTKGLSRDKCILGCPFYGAAGKYKDIVAANPAAAWVDKDGTEDYNSIPTMRKKTNLALDRAGGIMFWELSQDATGELSLLSAVNEVIVKRVPTGILPGKPWISPLETAGASPVWTGRGNVGYRMGAWDGEGLSVDPVGRAVHPAGFK
ncbi:MAG: glycoside hydrolase family 18 [Fibrobacteres bacterium]|nr:glycoside hydrolase family 18 [Fibrobacterota bacterium]